MTQDQLNRYAAITNQITPLTQQYAQSRQNLADAQASGDPAAIAAVQEQRAQLLSQISTLDQQQTAILNGTDGTNDPVVTTSTSQSTSSQPATGPIDNAQNISGTPAVANSQPGAAAPSDDAGVITRSTVNQNINSATTPTGTINPQPNILDSFDSYTYSLSWYMLTPAQFSYALKVPTAQWNPTQWSLLIQSGGAAVNNTQSAPTVTGAYNNPATNTKSTVSGNRNPYFNLDYYLDDLEIETALGKNGMVAISSMKFKITEPTGITLLKNLNNAYRDLTKNPQANLIAAQFCMVINFYGYDSQGNQITHSPVTKYYPHIVTGLEFRMADKQIEYSVTAAFTSTYYGTSSSTASVPTNIELTGVTVDDLLNGSTNNIASANSSSDGRPTTSAPTSSSSAPLSKAVPNINGLVNTGTNILKNYTSSSAEIAAGQQVNTDISNNDGWGQG